jgi:hypothetical protein
MCPKFVHFNLCTLTFKPTRAPLHPIWFAPQIADLSSKQHMGPTIRFHASFRLVNNYDYKGTVILDVSGILVLNPLTPC